MAHFDRHDFPRPSPDDWAKRTLIYLPNMQAKTRDREMLAPLWADHMIFINSDSAP
jgi:hypothetical protein